MLCTLWEYNNIVWESFNRFAEYLQLLIILADDVVRRRGYGDHFVTMCVYVCGSVC